MNYNGFVATIPFPSSRGYKDGVRVQLPSLFRVIGTLSVLCASLDRGCRQFDRPNADVIRFSTMKIGICVSQIFETSKRSSQTP